MIRFLNKLFFGGSYKVAHIDCTTGKRKVFWCDSWNDAMQWVACALNEDKVTVTDVTGFVLTQRG